MKRQLIAATFGMATLVGCGGGSTTGSDDVAASDQALDSTQVASNEERDHGVVGGRGGHGDDR